MSGSILGCHLKRFLQQAPGFGRAALLEVSQRQVARRGDTGPPLEGLSERADTLRQVTLLKRPAGGLLQCVGSPFGFLAGGQISKGAQFLHGLRSLAGRAV